jgi:transcription elongation factor Elf1
MDHVDMKYAGILSTRLDKFSVKSYNPYKANCRCIICGDSQKSKTKARGWILDKSNKGFYYCHNCGVSLPLWKFIRTVDPALYDEYVIDTKLERDLLEKKPIKPLDKLTQKRPAFQKGTSPLRKIKKISQLKPDHPVRKYIQKRAIPTNQHHKLYYAPKFKLWVNSLIPDKLTSREEPRLILPFIDQQGNMFGFQGRAFDPKSIRYITIMLDEEKPKIFGLNTVNFNQKYYIVEGPIDSLFIRNSVAMAGADGNAKGLHKLENAVYVFDNEPRNRDIVKRMERVLARGHSVVIWPEQLTDKDINDIFLSGHDPQQIIDNNIYKGLEGELQLKVWRKV